MSDFKFINGDQKKLNQEDIKTICDARLPSKAIEGIHLFNEGRFWDAHEALEEAWLAQAGPERTLYKGILQAGVMYLHIERKNFIGMAKMYERAKGWLSPWPDQCRGINIKKLINDIDNAILAAGKLGPEKLGEFDHKLFKHIEFSDK